jgi:hypothetical protein
MKTMLRPHDTVLAALIALLLQTACPTAAPSSSAADHAPPDEEQVGISLRVLFEKVRECTHGAYPKELAELSGIHRIHGYVIDRENHDVVLVATRSRASAADPQPALHLEDFVTALRNVHKMYLDRERRWSPPSCSIDPYDEVIAYLEKVRGLMDELARQDGVGTAAYATVKQRWKEAGESLQRVSVLGALFESRFADVMVRADYDMKLVLDGSHPVAVPGFRSMRDLMRQDIARGLKPPRSMMNRYWFAKATAWFHEGDDVRLFEDFHPVLLTEEEYLSQAGKVEGKGHPNPYALAVTRSFTTHYAAIARAEAGLRTNTLYLELANLYRWLALAQSLVDARVFEQAALDITPVLNEYREPAVAVPRQLKGRVNALELNRGEERFEFLSCGGVEMEVGLHSRRLSPTRRAALGQFARAALQRSDSRVLAWRIAPGHDLPALLRANGQA